LSGSVFICPIGFVEPYVLDDLVACIETRCGIGCAVYSSMEAPEYAYDERRCQYDSKSILKQMIKRCPRKTLGFMGVTGLDLFVPILKYVYGLSQVQGRCSLISTHRLDPRFYGEPPDSNLLMSRIEKTALHELGHSFGLIHCRNLRCIMCASTKIEHTDFKQPDLCPTCLELLKWHINLSSSHP
jgi:archaemetzincin